MSADNARRVIRGLYAVTPDTDDTAALVRDVAAAIAGGATLIQYRNKIAASNLRNEQAKALKALCRERGAVLIVNDFVDLAHTVDADGVHLGKDDGAAAEARAVLGSGKIIGPSRMHCLSLEP